ncbi:hypothetical protein [Nonomuraea dietziae]|uniref:hypothetical protein n=1 Tax=Nonomuraea dietziae TaxID=65515 RepID=UPI0033C61684
MNLSETLSVPVTLPDGQRLAPSNYLPGPDSAVGSIPRPILNGRLIPIHTGALPFLPDAAPFTAVILDRSGPYQYEAYAAVAPIAGMPFLSLRWDADAQQVADVACWEHGSDAIRAAYHLAVWRGAESQVRIGLRWYGRGARRVIGPRWGGIVTRTGGRCFVYTDHQDEPIGTAQGFVSGARKLARHHGHPFRSVVIEDTH